MSSIIGKADVSSKIIVRHIKDTASIAIYIIKVLLLKIHSLIIRHVAMVLNTRAYEGLT